MFKYKILVITILLYFFCGHALAEDNTDEVTDLKSAPYMFVGIQGGIQTTSSKDYNNIKLITPTASISFGAFFTPIIGARLHVNGIWNKGGYAENEVDFKYNYKYTTINLDVMINLVNLISRRSYSPINVYFINGFGLNMAWNNEEAYAHKEVLPYANNNTYFSHNIRFGAMIDYNITPNVCVNLEINGNSLDDRYNSKLSDHADWQFTAQLGVVYKFGFRKK